MQNHRNREKVQNHRSPGNNARSRKSKKQPKITEIMDIMQDDGN